MRIQRMATFVSLVALLAFWAGAPSSARGDGDDDDDDDAAPNTSQFASVKFIGATVGLTKVEGGCWDPGCNISADDLARFRSGATKWIAKGTATGNWTEAGGGGRRPYGRHVAIRGALGVAGLVGSFTVGMSSKPDPTGTVELSVDTQSRGAVRLPRVMNTYTPLWSMGPWTHVPLDHDVRVQLHLEDYDWPTSNDQIATVEINSADLVRAARLQKVLSVFVGDQGTGQLMFVSVSVTMEQGS